nr:immunoglobulin heavy chain junction region [Macaca mulatta]
VQEGARRGLRVRLRLTPPLRYW